jgi:heat shock protein HspQ
MNKLNDTKEVKFHIGQIIQHKLFDYRGVVVDVDSEFSGSDEWYNAVARSKPPKEKPWYHVLPDGSDHSKPPKEKPWYHVLPDGSDHTTYVAERNLEKDESGKPINHPAVGMFFSDFKDGTYITNKGFN